MVKSTSTWSSNTITTYTYSIIIQWCCCCCTYSSPTICHIIVIFYTNIIILIIINACGHYCYIQSYHSSCTCHWHCFTCTNNTNTNNINTRSITQMVILCGSITIILPIDSFLPLHIPSNSFNSSISKLETICICIALARHMHERRD
jgi:hypothetical protein